MAVDLNLNAIRLPAAGPNRSAGRRRTTNTDDASRDHFDPPSSRAHLNFIPSSDSLHTLINSAMEALRRGVYWDRGTILNLLV